MVLKLWAVDNGGLVVTVVGYLETRAGGIGSNSCWMQALNCARTLRQLTGVGIFTVAQLRNSNQRWLAWREVASCGESKQAYQTILQLLTSSPELDGGSGEQFQPTACTGHVTSSLELNNCIAPVVHRRAGVPCGRWRSSQAVTVSL